jgi:SAM-dependent methyltransferase
MKPSTCPCCQGGLQQVDSWGGYAQLRCEACGYERFVSDDAPISTDYEQDADYLDDLTVFPFAKDRIGWHHLHAITFISRHISKDARTLDIGCFDGFFVRQMVDLGFDAWGLDFNRIAISQGQRQFALDGRITNHTTAELVAEGAQFSVITMFEVVEHLDDFGPVLMDCISLLEPGGYLVISVPNSEMSWRPLLDFPPHHLSRFTPYSLARLVSGIGLTSVYAVEQASLFDFLRNYAGQLFRKKEATSMRGGEFRNRAIVDPLRRMANRSKRLFYLLLSPFDWLLHRAGFRYIGQLVIARRTEC